MNGQDRAALDAALAARFGEAGVRRFAQAPAAADPAAPEAAALARIAALTLPLQVGPYFRTAPGASAALRGYALAAAKPLAAAEQLAWSRLGHDRAYEIVADPQGRVHALHLGYREPLRFVSSSPEAFAAALLGLDSLLDALGATDSPAQARAAFDGFRLRLQQADPAAFADRESWWPLVLDDLRDTAGADNAAAFEITGEDGEKTVHTATGTIGLHPEERLWASLHSAGITAAQVTGVHTELEACFLPGHYCSLWLAALFPRARRTHSFRYGATAASRAEGMDRLRATAVRQAGGAT
ncbi:hypothetical protein GXW83_21890 [Streptacidiphilus sp. PB12-B1b]|uniref:nucleic acid/nucleotide deaminase domain-containing protein n=1 Tax=Streptacidiphilus sp. PB12-B1b TaxID=2705012 RepID=UPI0015FDAF56|nr:nucleic acid/nucleotide deaminase domain-containing protein [Streptacidiphilus sp. PB12-B1b]QMU77952.1 hypothetical protein GXW83_21890 [Streptacidiphilus sp. PB12-B1b]